MKTLRLVPVLIILNCLTLYGQRNYANIATYTVDNDTMSITKEDRVSSVLISVPDWGTDSCTVFGVHKEIAGFATSIVTIAPGESISIGTGSGGVSIGPLNIIGRSGSKTRVFIIPVY